MLAEISSRDNRELVEYYKASADLIGVFWQFHRARIELDGVEMGVKGQKVLRFH